MPTLKDVLESPEKKELVVNDCCKLIDDEVGDKGGISGFAIKAGYAAVKGIKPGFIKQVVSDLLPEFSAALDPIWQEGKAAGKPTGKHLQENSARVADALLGITDAKAQRSKSGVVKGTYDKLRPMAKKHVESAVPRLAALLDQHAS